MTSMPNGTLLESPGPDRVLHAKEYSTCKMDEAVKLRMENEWPGSRKPISIPTLITK